MEAALIEASELAWAGGQAIGGAVDDERAELVVLHGRLLVSHQLLPVVASEGVRPFAERSGFAVGTISDMVNGRTGPPLPKNAVRLDAAAGTETEVICRETREQAAAIRKESAERAAELVEGAGPVHDRLSAVALRLAGDDDLLALVERVAALPPPVRAGLIALVSSLEAR
jgi:hypothetical protein